MEKVGEVSELLEEVLDLLEEALALGGRARDECRCNASRPAN